jgi:hypothetical protein
MEFPLKEYAIESEQEPAILDHKIVQTLLNQATKPLAVAPDR